MIMATEKNESNQIDVEENIGLVHLCAKRFTGRGVDYDDLFQAGCIGLIKAARAFNRELGNKFSTYAVPVILGEIRGLFREGGAVKISRGVRDLSKRVQEETNRLREETGKNPSVSEVAENLGVSTEKVVMVLGATKTPMSLTDPDANADIEIPVEAPEEQLTDRITLRQIISSMEERDQRLIGYRYFKNKTQQETADLLGMTQVQVSRREKKLLMYMRTLL